MTTAITVTTIGKTLTKKNKATNDAGLKIYRWQVNQTPNAEEIRQLFDGKL